MSQEDPMLLQNIPLERELKISSYLEQNCQFDTIPPLLVYGSTGSGKTYTVMKMSSLFSLTKKWPEPIYLNLSQIVSE